MAAPNKTDWYEIRNDYLQNAEVSYADLAKKYGLSRKSVQARGTKEGWPKLRQELADRAFDKFQEKLLDIKSKAQNDHLISYQNMRAIVNRQILQIAERRVPLLDKKGNPVIDRRDKKNPVPLFVEPDPKELEQLSKALRNAIAGERIVLGLPSSVAGLTDGRGDNVWTGFAELVKNAEKVVKENAAPASTKDTDDTAGD